MDDASVTQSAFTKSPTRVFELTSTHEYFSRSKVVAVRVCVSPFSGCIIIRLNLPLNQENISGPSTQPANVVVKTRLTKFTCSLVSILRPESSFADSGLPLA